MAHNQKLDAYPMAPGCDFFTKSTRTPCIDTGIDIDQYTPNSRIYVSEDTVGEWARMFGWISPTDAENLRLAASAEAEHADELQAEVHRLRVIEQALLAGGFTIPTPEEVPVTEFPNLKGGGWWLLSNGETVRGSREVAVQAEQALHAEVAA